MLDNSLLIVDQSGSQLTLQQGRIQLTPRNGVPQSFPLNALGSVIVHGNVQLDSKLLRALADAQVITIFLPGRGAGGSAYLHGELGAPVKARLQQYACYQHAPTRLHIARYLVGEKIAAQAKHLEQRKLAVPKSLQMPEDTNITDLAGLMGIEGASAAAYFAAPAQDIDSSWRFTGRNRRPPRDPINALLSLSYTLLLGNMRHAVLGAGLDPLLGFLHQIYP